MKPSIFKRLGMVVCLFFPLLLTGCVYRAVLKDGRMIQKYHYSVGLPSGKWHGYRPDIRYGGGGSGHYTYVEAQFGFCPNNQMMDLEEVSWPQPPSIAKYRSGLPADIRSDSFESLAYHYLETNYPFVTAISSASQPTLLSISTKTLAGSTYVDAVYRDRAMASPSCGATHIEMNYKERFIVIDMPPGSFPKNFSRPRLVVLSYHSPEGTYEEHSSDFEKWISTFQVMP